MKILEKSFAVLSGLREIIKNRIEKSNRRMMEVKGNDDERQGGGKTDGIGQGMPEKGREDDRGSIFRVSSSSLAEKFLAQWHRTISVGQGEDEGRFPSIASVSSTQKRELNERPGVRKEDERNRGVFSELRNDRGENRTSIPRNTYADGFIRKWSEEISETSPGESIKLSDKDDMKKSILIKSFTVLTMLRDLIKARRSDPRQLSLFDETGDIKPALHQEKVPVVATTRTNKKTGAISQVVAHQMTVQKKSEVDKLVDYQKRKANHILEREGKGNAEFELKTLPISSVIPVQGKPDYDNSSSRELSKHILQHGSSGRENDYAPIAVDENMKIIDGHHRWFARKLAGEKTIVSLVVKKPLHPTETPEFKRWFAGSKVVDKDGKPLVVYHGSKADIHSFYPDSHFGTSGQANQLLASVNSSLENERQYSGKKARVESDSVYPVYLSIKNPKRVEDVGSNELWKEEIEQAKKEGYDGIVYANIEEVDFDEAGGLDPNEDSFPDSWIAFSPLQVKSAIGNQGTFDPSDPDITKSIILKSFLTLTLIQKAITEIHRRATTRHTPSGDVPVKATVYDLKTAAKQAAIDTARKKTMTDKQRLVYDHMADASKLAGFYAGKYFAKTRGALEHDEFEQAALLGMVEAAENFDPSRGVAFLTYAHHYIGKRIFQMVSHVLDAVSLPEKVLTRWIAYQQSAEKEAFLPIEKIREIDRKATDKGERQSKAYSEERSRLIGSAFDEAMKDSPDLRNLSLEFPSIAAEIESSDSALRNRRITSYAMTALYESNDLLSKELEQVLSPHEHAAFLLHALGWEPETIGKFLRDVEASGGRIPEMIRSAGAVLEKPGYFKKLHKLPANYFLSDSFKRLTVKYGETARPSPIARVLSPVQQLVERHMIDPVTGKARSVNEVAASLAADKDAKGLVVRGKKFSFSRATVANYLKDLQGTQANGSGEHVFTATRIDRDIGQHFIDRAYLQIGRNIGTFERAVDENQEYREPRIVQGQTVIGGSMPIRTVKAFLRR